MAPTPCTFGAAPDAWDAAAPDADADAVPEPDPEAAAPACAKANTPPWIVVGALLPLALAAAAA